MIKTEGKRSLLETNTKGICLPKNVQEALNKADPDLTAFYNDSDNQWEFYRLKYKGITPAEDVFSWQMSAPQKGTGITPGIVFWLQRYNTNPQRVKSREELEKEFLELARSALQKKEERKNKEFDNLYESTAEDIMNDLFRQRTQVSVPVQVGYNSLTNKKIFAVPRGTTKKIKKNKELIV